jgi:hypothetical protein
MARRLGRVLIKAQVGGLFLGKADMGWCIAIVRF